MKKCIMIISILFIIFAVKFTCDVSTMNKYELHYDANGLFIIVDRNLSMVGVYNACTPIGHFYCNTNLFGTNDEVIEIITLFK